MKQQFQTRLLARGPKGAWTHMVVPFDVLRVFGSKARVPVHGTINGFPFRTSIMPEGNGAHYMAVTREMQKGANAAAGDTVQVTMAIDSEERTVPVPEDLKAALAAAPQAEATFAGLAYSHRKEYVDWIEQARKPETRARRIEKALTMIPTRQRLNP
jgi:hypothetical protein